MYKANLPYLNSMFLMSKPHLAVISLNNSFWKMHVSVVSKMLILRQLVPSTVHDENFDTFRMTHIYEMGNMGLIEKNQNKTQSVITVISELNILRSSEP